jgi:diacylglycerol kinase family enzyme
VGYLVLLNPGSGSETDHRDLATHIERQLSGARVVPMDHQIDLAGAVGEAVAEGQVVVAGGGDGTVNAVAQHVVGRGTLGVLPTGTLNHFARDLRVREVDVALEALKAGTTQSIDVGRFGDRIFLNNAGMGLYPEMVYERERAEERTGKWRAAIAAARRVMQGADPMAGSIEADGDARLLFAWMLFMGNNRFGTTPGRIGQRERLDEGVLDLALLVAGPRGMRRSSMAWRALRSQPWQTSRRLVRREARRVKVRIDGSPRPVSWDGEAGDPTRELDVEIVPAALEVVVGPPD